MEHPAKILKNLFRFALEERHSENSNSELWEYYSAFVLDANEWMEKEQSRKTICWVLHGKKIVQLPPKQQQQQTVKKNMQFVLGFVKDKVTTEHTVYRASWSQRPKSVQFTISSFWELRIFEKVPVLYAMKNCNYSEMCCILSMEVSFSLQKISFIPCHES